MGAKKLKLSRGHYSKNEDKTIKEFYRKSWSKLEIAYQLFQRHETVRSPAGVQQRISVLVSEGELEQLASEDGKRVGKRYVTQEGLDWCNATFKQKQKVSTMLELREQKPSTKGDRKKRKTKKALNGQRKPTRKTTTREILGFTRIKGKDEPQPSYTVFVGRMSKEGGDKLALFEGMLGAAVAEGKTAVDVLDDLRLIAS